MPYNSFEEMPIWQKSMDLAVEIYDMTETLPRKEDYGLTSQISRSALSVPGNIAEGFGRKHTKDKLNFCGHVGCMTRLACARQVGGKERRPCNDITISRKPQPCLSRLNGMGEELHYDARGSLAETKSHLIYGHRVGYFPKNRYDGAVSMLEDVWKQLNSLINSLAQKIK